MSAVFTALKALLYMAGFIFLWGWIALGVRVYDNRLGVLLPPWAEIPGGILMTAGGLLALLCVGTFVIHGKGTAAPWDAPREFVARGPYRYVRNPMYIGGWIVLIGFGLYERSFSISIFSAAWLFLFHLFVLFYEEPGLEERFGQSYLDYKKKVNRWLPSWK